MHVHRFRIEMGILLFAETSRPSDYGAGIVPGQPSQAAGSSAAAVASVYGAHLAGAASASHGRGSAAKTCGKYKTTIV